MKKILLSIAAIAALSTASQAQLFVTGSVGLTTSGGTIKNTSGSTSTEIKKPSEFGIEFSPKVGYYLNEKFAIGAALSLGSISRTSYNYTGFGANRSEKEINKDSSIWAFTPFARYNAVKAGKLALLAEGYLGIFGGSSSTKTETVTVDGPSTFGFGLGVKPVLEFELNEHWALESELNFLNLGFSTQTDTQKNDNNETSVSTNKFIFGVNKGQTVSMINIGVTYKF